MITSRGPVAPPATRRRRRRSPFLAFLGGLVFLVMGSAVGFLSGAGAGSIWTRLVPEAPDVLGLKNDEPGIRVIEDGGVLVAQINPRSVRLDLARGWDQETSAFHDNHALLYFTGPFFEERKGQNDYDARAIGDLYFYGDLTPASEASRPFADRRYYLAITRKRRVDFGYGGWKRGYERKYRVFVGGLGFLYDSSGELPRSGYSDPYGNLKQRLHEAVPRERLIVGRNKRGQLVVLKTPPRTTPKAARIAREEGLLEAYYVDQGNKARFIVPGQIDDKPRHNLPYLLRVAERDQAWIPPPREPSARKRPRG
ncbi:MAG: hypothetical protein FJZ01_18770 [Candidatus Sericytochromatia bacterium]|nr:hypothetical protein [Candidatus Tanganyikabacteria bacterium]